MNTIPAKATNTHAKDFIKQYHALCGDKPAWLSYHFAHLTPFAIYLLRALTDCENRVPQLGQRFIKELHAVKYVSAKVSADSWKARFEELIQKLSEILVARTLCRIEWPAETTIQFEPENKSNGKRPEFSVTTPERTWLFEVKCPSFIAHQNNRATNAHQLPIRGFMRNSPHIEGETVTLPRDNTLKDFLKSAQEKFQGFGDDNTTGILVVVWDMSMYEAIGALSHPEAGLLTDKTWLKINDVPVTFPDVSGVIVINRLEQLKLGTQENLNYIDPFELGGPDALPNTWCPNKGVGDLDALIAKGFDAFHFEGTAIGAEYSMMDYVMWFESPSSIARREARRRRRRQFIRELNCSSSYLGLS